MSKFRSIRWRLVAGFTLLTLLTVTLLGVLVLSLMQRYVARQESAYLNQNATAIAQQSALFFVAPLPPQELTSLARTAAILGNFHVKILNADQEILVDSTFPRNHDHLTWIPPFSEEAGQVQGGQGQDGQWQEEFVIIDSMGGEFFLDEQTVDLDMETAAQSIVESAQAEGLEQHIGKIPTPYQIRIVRQNQGGWGPLLEFERASTTSSSITTTELLTDTRRSLSTFIERSNDIGIVAGIVADLGISAPVLQRVRTPIHIDEGIVGYVELRSASGVAAEALVALRRLFLLAGMAVSTIAVAVGLIVSNGLTAPIQALTVATSRMNQGDLTARAAVQSSDEIGLLAHAFNRMATALEKNFTDLAAERDALRTFIGDASHELRTPITALRTFNELLQDSAANDPAAHTEFLAESGLQLRRLERVTDSLLNLSRLDGGLIALAIEEVRVDELVAHVIDMLRSLAAERMITLTIAPIAPTLIVHCDRDQLERALVNLVENALKFTEVNGNVQVGAEADNDNETGAGKIGQTDVTIWVKDNGIGIAPAEQTSIFRRFYRGPNATNGGSGLGLAIVQSVVQAHGGTVTVGSVEGQGSRFQLHLPVSPSGFHAGLTPEMHAGSDEKESTYR